MDTKQIRKRATDRESTVEELPEIPDQAEAQAVLEDIDSLLDEIDSVLEENAEEFVNAYVQKGGE